MLNVQNRLIDFTVTEQKIVNDIVSGPLWKKPLRNYNLYSFSFVSKMDIHNCLKRLLKIILLRMCGLFHFHRLQAK